MRAAAMQMKLCLAQLYFVEIIGYRNIPTLYVVIGVVTDGMACLQHAVKNLRILSYIIANAKESGFEVVPL